MRLPLDVDTPALVLDEEALRRNIERMAKYFAGKAAGLRPHFKTHKSTRIAKMQMEAGAIGITCAKVGEAEALVGDGIRDVLIANEVVTERKIGRLMRLLEKAEVKVAVDDAGNVAELSRAARAAGRTLGVLVEVDVGMGRCGVAPGEATVRLAREVAGSAGLRLAGLMGYEGHMVLVESEEERRRGALEAMKTLMRTAREVREAGLGCEIVSSGGTGTYDMSSTVEGVTEIQAGSYAVMDARYGRVRREFENALWVAATVISVARKGTAVIDVGKKGLTEEFGMPVVVSPEGLTLKGLSEEHGKLEVGAGREARVGEQVMILPSHCCTTINLYDEYAVVRGGEVAELWRVDGRGKMQ